MKPEAFTMTDAELMDVHPSIAAHWHHTMTAYEYDQQKIKLTDDARRRKVHQQGFMSEESPQMVKETQYRAKAVDKLRGRVREMGRAKR